MKDLAVIEKTNKWIKSGKDFYHKKLAQRLVRNLLKSQNRGNAKPYARVIEFYDAYLVDLYDAVIKQLSAEVGYKVGATNITLERDNQLAFGRYNHIVLALVQPIR